MKLHFSGNDFFSHFEATKIVFCSSIYELLAGSYTIKSSQVFFVKTLGGEYFFLHVVQILLSFPEILSVGAVILHEVS